jgi:hypothetical protein
MPDNRDSQRENNNTFLGMIIVALIGLIGTILTIFKDPLVSTFYKTPTPFATMSTPAFIPPALSPAAPGAVNAVTRTPIASSTYPPTYSSPSVGCFDSNIWTPYNPGPNMSPSEGCWDLSAWGMRMDGNTIDLAPAFSLTDGQFHAVYSAIPTFGEVSFDILVTSFDLARDRSGVIGVGIINISKPGSVGNRMIYFHYSFGADTILEQLVEDGKYTNTLWTRLRFSKPQSIDMKLNGRQLTITIDGKDAGNMDVPYLSRGLWLSYSIPPDTRLNAVISNLEVH